MLNSITEAMAQGKTAPKRLGKRESCNKMTSKTLDISAIATTLIAMSRNPEVDRDDLSHSAEFLGKEIRRRTKKLFCLVDQLEDALDANEDAVPVAPCAVERKAAAS